LPSTHGKGVWRSGGIERHTLISTLDWSERSTSHTSPIHPLGGMQTWAACCGEEGHSDDLSRTEGNTRRGQLKCDGTRAETRFRLSAKRMSPFKSAGASVQSTTGSLGVRISGSHAGYTMFRDSVKGTGYPLHSPVSPSLPLPCVAVCHHISTGVHHLTVMRFGLKSVPNRKCALAWYIALHRWLQTWSIPLSGATR